MKKILIAGILITGLHAMNLEIEGKMSPECAEDIKTNKKEWKNCSQLTQKDKDKIRAALAIKEAFLKGTLTKDAMPSPNKIKSSSPEND